MTSQAVDRTSLGAWLLKSSPDPLSRAEWLATGFAGLSARCVRRTYRVDLVAAGQPVLLWFSGDDREHPAGIYAQGRTTGRAVDEGGTLEMPVALETVEPPVLRRELLEHPVLSSIEVVRMAAGSNPSFLTRAQLAELRQTWPQVTVG